MDEDSYDTRQPASVAALREAGRDISRRPGCTAVPLAAPAQPRR